VEKKLITKIELDRHVLNTKLSADSCRILNKDLEKQLNEIMLWNNSKKGEKQVMF
jgi:hypothetical protein